MRRLNNPLEGTRFNPAHTDVAVEALKRGRNGEGRQPLEVVIDNLGVMATLTAADRQRIADVVEKASIESDPLLFGGGVELVISDRLEEQRREEKRWTNE